MVLPFGWSFNYFVNFSRDHLLWTIGPDTAQVSHRHLILKHRYLLIVNLLLSFLRVSIRAWLMHDLIHNSTNLLLLAYSQLLSNLLRLIRVHIQALFFTTGWLHKGWELGIFHEIALSFCAKHIRPTFTVQKASQMLGFMRCAQLYVIDPRGNVHKKSLWVALPYDLALKFYLKFYFWLAMDS